MCTASTNYAQCLHVCTVSADHTRVNVYVHSVYKLCTVFTDYTMALVYARYAHVHKLLMQTWCLYAYIRTRAYTRIHAYTYISDLERRFMPPSPPVSLEPHIWKEGSWPGPSTGVGARKALQSACRGTAESTRMRRACRHSQPRARACERARATGACALVPLCGHVLRPRVPHASRGRPPPPPFHALNRISCHCPGPRPSPRPLRPFDRRLPHPSGPADAAADTGPCPPPFAPVAFDPLPVSPIAHGALSRALHPAPPSAKFPGPFQVRLQPLVCVWGGGGEGLCVGGGGGIRGRPTVRGKSTYGGWPAQRVEEQGTWASQKHSEAGYGWPVDRGVWTAKTVKRSRQQPAHPQYANYWAPLTHKRHTMPHSAQPQHTDYWAPRTRKRHQQEHRPQRPTERSDPTQHAKGRTGDCPGPRKGTTTRRNVTQGARGCV